MSLITPRRWRVVAVDAGDKLEFARPGRRAKVLISLPKAAIAAVKRGRMWPTFYGRAESAESLTDRYRPGTDTIRLTLGSGRRAFCIYFDLWIPLSPFRWSTSDPGPKLDDVAEQLRGLAGSGAFSDSLAEDEDYLRALETSLVDNGLTTWPDKMPTWKDLKEAATPETLARAESLLADIRDRPEEMARKTETSRLIFAAPRSLALPAGLVCLAHDTRDHVEFREPGRMAKTLFSIAKEAVTAVSVVGCPAPDLFWSFYGAPVYIPVVRVTLGAGRSKSIHVLFRPPDWGSDLPLRIAIAEGAARRLADMIRSGSPERASSDGDDTGSEHLKEALGRTWPVVTEADLEYGGGSLATMLPVSVLRELHGLEQDIEADRIPIEKVYWARGEILDGSKLRRPRVEDFLGR